MTIFAHSWFFRSPGRDSLNIAERVRQSLWASGLYSLWLEAGSESAPFHMIGNHGKDSLELEWEPAAWLRLRIKREDSPVCEHLTWVLGQGPSLRFTDQHGWTVWEWQLQDDTARWREISGNPIYRNPCRFD